MSTEHGADRMSWCTPDHPLTVHQTRCVRVRNRHARCSACIDACPAQAVSYEDNVLRVDPDRCMACGVCVSVCPTGALELKAQADEALYRASVAVLKKTGTTVTVACARCLKENAGTYDPELVVKVPCLGRVDEGLLMTLAALGAEEVQLAYGGCGSCPSSSGIERAAEVAAGAADLLALLGYQANVDLSPELPDAVLADGVQAADQDEFGPAFPMAAVGAGSEPEQFRLAKMTPQKVLARHVPDKRKRLLKAFALMARAIQLPEEPVQTNLWANIKIDPVACASCRACAIFCPTGALSKMDGEVFGVSHVVGLCVNCGCCQDVCNHRALEVVTEVTPAQIVGGEVRPIELRAIEHPNGKHDSMYWRMKDLLGVDNLYLR